jgi:molybdopterin-binding protein
VRLSTRNQLKGTITQVDIGSVMAIVKIRLNGGGQVVTSSVTKDAALELSLKEGQPATVLARFANASRFSVVSETASRAAKSRSANP